MTRVLIVEDIAGVRDWLTGVVADACSGAQISTAGGVRAARACLGGEPYDLAIVDLGLPDGSGFEVLRAVKSESPGTLCVVATILGDDASIVGALAAGADGYVLKDQPGDLLTRHIRQTLDGLPALSPSIARRIMDHFRNTGPVAAEADLTSRERDVLAQIGRGLRNREAATALGISEHTVAAHIKSVYRKLDISSRAEAAWHAARLGL